MGMYDRDWYREERRQQRQSRHQQPATQPLQTVENGPPSVFSVKSMLIVTVAFIAALIVLGFA
jgi:hypothetical protein